MLDIDDTDDIIQSLPSKDDKVFRLNNKRMLVTYSTHIDKTQLSNLFASKGQKLTFFRAAHESADKLNPYLHTHVLAEYEKPLQSTDCRCFDINKIHPNIQTIKTNLHYTRCKRYLAKEDTANTDLLEASDKPSAQSTIKDIWECKTLQAALFDHCNVKNTTQIIALFNSRPETPPDMPKFALKRWQVTLRNELVTPWIKYSAPDSDVEDEDFGIVDEDAPPIAPFHWNGTRDGRKIIVVYDPKGRKGKNTFIDYLIYRDPTRFIMLQGIPPLRDLSETIKTERAKGWIGETVLINLVRQCSDRKFYEPLEALADGSMTCHKYQGGNIKYPVRNIVLFSNFMPKISAVTEDRWDIRGIRESDGLMTRIPTGKAKAIYATEKSGRDSDNFTPPVYTDFSTSSYGDDAPTFAGIIRG